MRGYNAPVTIDGQRFPTIKWAYALAISKGYKGSKALFYSRILKANYETTWEHLLSPPDSFYKAIGAKGSVIRDSKRTKAKDEMRELMAELDRRKAEIAARE